MVDASSYLNYPGLKYLQKNPSVDWSDSSSCYLSYSGLKRMDRGQEYSDSSKNFLSHEGLMYLLFARLVKVAKQRREEKIRKRDSSIFLEYGDTTGEVTLLWQEGNTSLYTEGDDPAVIQNDGELTMLVYEGRYLDVPIWIDDNGEVKLTYIE